MFLSRTSRLPLRITCIALAWSGCVQLSGRVAHAQPGDLDSLAYGDLQASKPARQDTGIFSGLSFMSDAAPAPRPAADAAPAPRVIMATPPARATRAPVSAGGGGLLEALGLRFEPATSGPMDSNAQLAPAPLPAPVAAPVLAPAPAARVAPVMVPVAYPAPAIVGRDSDYKVDAGDKLRVVVFGQEGLTNTYAIDAGGGITMPLIGRVAARGMTPSGLAAHITTRLRKGYIREPSVAVEVESYRPFFILGEVAAPGQYPYVPNMSVEAAIAIAGGFSPRARRDGVTLTRKADGGQTRAAVPLGTPLNPGDTIMVSERWF